MAKLDPAVYTTPALLHEASATGDPQAGTVSLSGNLLTVAPQQGYTGTLVVTVSATDGRSKGSAAFRVTVM